MKETAIVPLDKNPIIIKDGDIIGFKKTNDDLFLNLKIGNQEISRTAVKTFLKRHLGIGHIFKIKVLEKDKGEDTITYEKFFGCTNKVPKTHEKYGKYYEYTCDTKYIES